MIESSHVQFPSAVLMCENSEEVSSMLSHTLPPWEECCYQTPSPKNGPHQNCWPWHKLSKAPVVLIDWLYTHLDSTVINARWVRSLTLWFSHFFASPLALRFLCAAFFPPTQPAVSATVVWTAWSSCHYLIVADHERLQWEKCPGIECAFFGSCFAQNFWLVFPHSWKKNVLLMFWCLVLRGVTFQGCAFARAWVHTQENVLNTTLPWHDLLILLWSHCIGSAIPVSGVKFEGPCPQHCFFSFLFVACPLGHGQFLGLIIEAMNDLMHRVKFT